MSEQVDSGAIDVEPRMVRRVYGIVTKRGSLLSESDTASVYKLLNPTLPDGTAFRMLTTTRDYPTTIEDPDDLGEIIGCVDADDAGMGDALMMVQVLGVNSRSPDGDPLDVSIVFVTCYGSLPEGAIIFLKYPMGINYAEGSSLHPQGGQIGGMVEQAAAGEPLPAPQAAPSDATPAPSSSFGGTRWLWAIGIIAIAMIAAVLFLRSSGAAPL